MAADTKKTNLYEKVYLSIKQSIIRGEFQPGEKLKETKLAELLNASRTPIRDALRKLEQEGLVTLFPSQGAEVTGLSKETIVNLYECRSVLEGLAARKAITNMNSDGINILEESIVLSRRYFEKNDLDKVVEKNTLFHDTILHFSKNPSLMQMMDNIRTQILRYRTISSSFGFSPTFLEEHWDIFKAISEGDGDTAEKSMKQHIMNDLSTILRELEHSIK